MNEADAATTVKVGESKFLIYSKVAENQSRHKVHLVVVWSFQLYPTIFLSRWSLSSPPFFFYPIFSKFFEVVDVSLKVEI